MNTELNKAIENVIWDAKDSSYNFILARLYEDLDQTSSAISYYLRAAEFSSDTLLSYESLLRIAICLDKQKDRNYHLKGVLLRAISLFPKRPEAYFLLCKNYEATKQWHECYAFACIGESTCSDQSILRTSVDYPGLYAFTFERAVSAWWIGLYDESIHLFRTLERRSDIWPIYANIVKNNVFMFGRSYKRPIVYSKELYPQLINKFPGADKIERNYSQCYQDMFVLSMLNGKRSGKFLEIGCDDAYFNSNTALLEKSFGWSGISIDIDPVKTEKFAKERSSKVITDRKSVV
jgi:tetratricopeptide (TPR) repeat protein